MKEKDNMLLNVAKIEKNCNVLGPGQRYVIWLQGCILDCTGCINLNFQSLEVNQLVNVNWIIDDILSHKNEIEGVTFTGGEPFLQPDKLTTIAKNIKEEGLNVLCYTGFTLTRLIDSYNEDVYNLLDSIDVLIDGPYQKENRVNVGYRGSSNQKVHFFTDIYGEKDFITNNSFEVNCSEKEMRIVGFFDGKTKDVSKQLFKL